MYFYLTVLSAGAVDNLGRSMPMGDRKPSRTMSLGSKKAMLSSSIRLYTAGGAWLYCEGDENASHARLYYLPSYDRPTRSVILYGYTSVTPTGIVADPQRQIPLPDVDSVVEEHDVILVVSRSYLSPKHFAE